MTKFKDSLEAIYNWTDEEPRTDSKVKDVGLGAAKSVVGWFLGFGVILLIVLILALLDSIPV